MDMSLQKRYYGRGIIGIERDYFRIVKKCHQCQIHGDLINYPPLELHSMTSPCPFVAWGMDVIGQTSQKPLMDIDSLWSQLITLPNG